MSSEDAADVSQFIKAPAADTVGSLLGEHDELIESAGLRPDAAASPLQLTAIALRDVDLAVYDVGAAGVENDEFGDDDDDDDDDRARGELGGAASAAAATHKSGIVLDVGLDDVAGRDGEDSDRGDDDADDAGAGDDDYAFDVDGDDEHQEMVDDAIDVDGEPPHHHIDRAVGAGASPKRGRPSGTSAPHNAVAPKRGVWHPAFAEAVMKRLVHLAASNSFTRDAVRTMTCAVELILADLAAECTRCARSKGLKSVTFDVVADVASRVDRFGFLVDVIPIAAGGGRVVAAKNRSQALSK